MEKINFENLKLICLSPHARTICEIFKATDTPSENEIKILKKIEEDAKKLKT